MKTVDVKCLECESVFAAPAREVKRGNGKFCSRSCFASYNNRKRKRGGKRILAYAERRAVYGATFVVSSAVSTIKARARKKGIPCELTSDLFWLLWTNQAGKCFYTARKMTIGAGTRTYFDMDQASVDRVVPEKGYVNGNMVLCCRWVNTAKMQGTIGELVERVKELLKGPNGIARA